jgi:hypothetical protein
VRCTTQPAFRERTSAQRREAAVRQDHALPDHDHALGERLDVVHVVRREDDRDAVLAVQRLHEVAHGKLRDGVEADRRLVQKQHAWLVQHARRDLAAHPLAEGELTHRRVEECLEVEQGDQRVRVFR